MGLAARVTPDAAQLLGHAPRTWWEFASDTIACPAAPGETIRAVVYTGNAGAGRLR